MSSKVDPSRLLEGDQLPLPLEGIGAGERPAQSNPLEKSYLTKSVIGSPKLDKSDRVQGELGGPGVSYQLKPVNCGKSECQSCPHGPYWYAFWKEGGKTRTRYIGKDLPDQSRANPASTSAGETSQ